MPAGEAGWAACRASSALSARISSRLRKIAGKSAGARELSAAASALGLVTGWRCGPLLCSSAELPRPS
eukprot:14653022-Alexandrium_andersonii.AAC.1